MLCGLKGSMVLNTASTAQVRMEGCGTSVGPRVDLLPLGAPWKDMMDVTVSWTHGCRRPRRESRSTPQRGEGSRRNQADQQKVWRGNPKIKNKKERVKVKRKEKLDYEFNVERLLSCFFLPSPCICVCVILCVSAWSTFNKHISGIFRPIAHNGPTSYFFPPFFTFSPAATATFNSLVAPN